MSANGKNSGVVISIRRAGSADADTVADMIHRLLCELSGTNMPQSPKIPTLVSDIFREGSGVWGFLADDGSELPLGILMLNRCWSVYAGGSFGEITELYVDPNHRSHGVAAALIRHVVEFSFTVGWNRLEVGAPAQPTWSRTIDFYLREGFEEVGPRLSKTWTRDMPMAGSTSQKDTAANS